MAVRISRNPLAFRPRSKPVRVVVDADKRELGVVHVTVCEIPKGLLQEIRDDAMFLTGELEHAGAELDKVMHIDQEQTKHWREKRREAQRALNGVQLTGIKWAVCDHKAEDFTDEESGESFTFQEEPSHYDGVSYRTASSVTLGAYVSVGQPFVQALYEAAMNWQRGAVVEPEEVWQRAEERAAKLKAFVDAKLKELSAPKTQEEPEPPLS